MNETTHREREREGSTQLHEHQAHTSEADGVGAATRVVNSGDDGPGDGPLVPYLPVRADAPHVDGEPVAGAHLQRRDEREEDWEPTEHAW